MVTLSGEKLGMLIGHIRPKCKYALNIDATNQFGAYECELASIKNEPIGIYVYGVSHEDVCPYNRFGMFKCPHYRRGEQ